MALKDDLELNKPKRTPNHPKKSHVVKTTVDGKPKLIRFGEQGAKTAGKPSPNDSAKTKAKRKSFKARHGKNIAKGPASAAYWANKIKWRDGGYVDGYATGGEIADVGADFLSGVLGPIAGAGTSLAEQAFTDNDIATLKANNEKYNNFLNYSPRTETGYNVNQAAMKTLGEGVTAAANAYTENKDNLGYIPDAVDAGVDYYNTMDPRKQFLAGNLLTVGEVLPIGKAASMAKNSIKNRADTNAIAGAASKVLPEEANIPLQTRLEEMGGKYNMDAYHGSSKSFDKFDPRYVGTGEGAQQYGIGAAYLSESSDLAKSYTPRDMEYERALGKRYSELEKAGDYEGAQVYEYAMQHYTPAEIRAMAIDPDSVLYDMGVRATDIADEIDKIPIKDFSLYKVQVDDFKVDRMIDLDKQLIDQDIILELLEPEIPGIAAAAKRYKDIDKDLKKRKNINLGKGKTLQAEAKRIAKKFPQVKQTGLSFYRATAFNKTAADSRGPTAASLLLKNLGIAGNKYIDPNFRDGKTRNFVVFDEKDAKIISRNGKNIEPEYTDVEVRGSFDDGKITPAGVTAARDVAELKIAQELTEDRKLSEMLGDANVVGKGNRIITTQADRTRIRDGAGPGYPIIGEEYYALAEKYYAMTGKIIPRLNIGSKDYPVWAVDDSKVASGLMNNLKKQGDMLIPMIGGPEQLITNSIVFGRLKGAFFDAVDNGKLKKDLAKKMNINLKAATGKDLDIRDPASWAELETTFDGRAILGGMMKGKATRLDGDDLKALRTSINIQRKLDGLRALTMKPPTVPLGGKKSQIFKFDDMLEEATESSLRGADTFSVGPTVVVPNRKLDPVSASDMHSGFEFQIMGERLPGSVKQTPLEISHPAFMEFVKYKERTTGKPFPYGMNARFGIKENNKGGFPSGLPSQEITEEYLKWLQVSGYAEGGAVDVEEYNKEKIDMLADQLIEGDKNIPDMNFRDESETLRPYIQGMGSESFSNIGVGLQNDVAGGNLIAGLNLSNMTYGEREYLRNDLFAKYNIDIGDVNLNADIQKPLDAEGVYLGRLNASMPLGNGQATISAQGVKTPYGSGVQGYNAGWAGEVGPGTLSANVNIPKGGSNSAQVQYRIPFAEGGYVEDIANFALGPFDVAADVVSGVVAPPISAAISGAEQLFSNKYNTLAEMQATKQKRDDALNYNARTPKGIAINRQFNEDMSQGIEALARTYNKNKDSLGPIPDMVDFGVNKYQELQPETQFALGNALGTAELAAMGGVGMGIRRGIKQRADTNAIREAADNVPIDDVYSNVRETLEQMGARQLMVKDKGGNWAKDNLDYQLEDLKIGKSKALSTWVDQKIVPYIRNDMGTGKNDPLIASTLEGEASYFNPYTRRAERDMYDVPQNNAEIAREYTLDAEFQDLPYNAAKEAVRIERAGDDLIGLYTVDSLLNPKNYDPSIQKPTNQPTGPNSLFEKTRQDIQYQMWIDNVPDELLRESPLSSEIFDEYRVELELEDITDEMVKQKLIKDNPWLAKADPSTKINVLDDFFDGTSVVGDLQLKRLMNGLQELTDTTNNFPTKLALTDEQLSKLTIGQASKRVGELNIYKEKEVLKGNLKNKPVRFNDPELQLTNFNQDKGMKWVDLNETDSAAGLGACTAIGKAGGWCTMAKQEAQAYTVDDKQLIVGLDAVGRPHIQIGAQVIPEDFLFKGSPSQININQIMPPENNYAGGKVQSYIKRDPDYQIKIGKSLASLLNDMDKNNQLEIAVGATSEFLPASIKGFDIYDTKANGFVRSFFFDQRNPSEADMASVRQGLDLFNGVGTSPYGDAKALVIDTKKLLKGNNKRFLTHKQLQPYILKALEKFAPSKSVDGFAEGGAVEYDKEKIDMLATELQNFAEGGIVNEEYDPIRINHSANLLLQEI